MNATAKILLADDDPAFVDANKVLLEKNGYEVCVAYSGDECWEKARAERPDLIVMDVMMETTTAGIGLVYRFKSDKETKDIPILMVTSVRNELPWLYESEDFWTLMSAYLEKPVKPKTLLDWVRRTARPRPFSEGGDEPREQQIPNSHAVG